MKCKLTVAALVFAAFAAPLHAEDADIQGQPRRSDAAELPALYECVPYAREATGIQLFGDALGWWDQAEGRYARGAAPRIGAAMALKPSGPMQLGHVAAVSRIVDSRTILLDHANWSPVDGERGRIERGVKAVDVSPRNDWSEVRIWYAPAGDLGSTRWPVQGFIYREKSAEPVRSRARQTVVAARPAPTHRVAARDPIGEILSGL